MEATSGLNLVDLLPMRIWPGTSGAVVTDNTACIKGAHACAVDF